MSVEYATPTPPADLSEIQQHLLLFLWRRIMLERNPPSNREIGEVLDINSTGHVDYHLGILEKKGYIERIPRKARGIKLLWEPQGKAAQSSQHMPDELTGARRRRSLREFAGVELLGSVAAGKPLSISPQRDVVNLSEVISSPDDTFALRIQGDSMEGIGIYDGDFIFVERRPLERSGQIVVATQTTEEDQGAATVKRARLTKEGVYLLPENPKHEPRFVPADEWKNEWEVQGIVVGMLRNFSGNKK